MIITVDAELCQGYGLCHEEAPELVELDDAGYALIAGDGGVSEGLRVVADKAVSMCPARALSLR